MTRWDENKEIAAASAEFERIFFGADEYFPLWIEDALVEWAHRAMMSHARSLTGALPSEL